MTPTPGRVVERGRSKAYRPLPPETRRVAIARGLAAYDRGDWYLAHEELEPAWMGTDDPAERALLSGVIKVAAAYVHAARGNPLGVRTNLRGARERLATATSARPAGWIDAATLLEEVEDRLARIEPLCEAPPDATVGDVDTGRPMPSHDVAGPAGRVRGAPVAILPIPLVRRPA